MCWSRKQIKIDEQNISWYVIKNKKLWERNNKFKSKNY